uniref:DUF7138 domain-containing protein n=1 Tax=Arundo donax TaxID=35708 RepID=A0A0A9F7G2_ARUDO
MRELGTSTPPTAVLLVVFVDGDQSVNLGTVTVQPLLSVRKLQAVIIDRVGLTCPSRRAPTSPPPSRARAPAATSSRSSTDPAASARAAALAATRRPTPRPPCCRRRRPS